MMLLALAEMHDDLQSALTGGPVVSVHLNERGIAAAAGVVADSRT